MALIILPKIQSSSAISLCLFHWQDQRYIVRLTVSLLLIYSQKDIDGYCYRHRTIYHRRRNNLQTLPWMRGYWLPVQWGYQSLFRQRQEQLLQYRPVDFFRPIHRSIRKQSRVLHWHFELPGKRWGNVPQRKKADHSILPAVLPW